MNVRYINLNQEILKVVSEAFFFWNRNLDATWFQIELDKTTGKIQKTCGDSSKQGCDRGNTW